MSENQKKIWVTGASTGIGKAVAEKFAKEGWKVAISARRTELLKKIATISEKEYGISFKDCYSKLLKATSNDLIFIENGILLINQTFEKITNMKSKGCNNILKTQQKTRGS